MEILKTLPSKDYLNLWSHQSRYSLVAPVNERDSPYPPTITENLAEESGSQAGYSPNGSVTSLDSSVSKSHNDLQHHSKQIHFVRAVPWRIQSKHYKDIQIRTHSSFVQIILSPATTGIRHSINANVCDEIVDCLRQVEDLSC